MADPLDLRFAAGKYGPFANRLNHLLNALDGSYRQCDRRIPDAQPSDQVRFDEQQRDKVRTYLGSGEAKTYSEALENVTNFIAGFESPLGLELLATVSWLLSEQAVEPTVEKERDGLVNWPGGNGSGERKSRIFDDRQIELALKRIHRTPAAVA